MSKINFITDNIGASQKSFYMIQAANELSRRVSPIIFYEHAERPCRKPLVPTLSLFEAWAQQGISIATTAQTAFYLSDFPGPHLKFYYVWDIGHGCFPANHVIRRKNLKLIARCEEHARIISNNYNREVSYIFDNFDVEKIMEVING